MSVITWSYIRCPRRRLRFTSIRETASAFPIWMVIPHGRPAANVSSIHIISPYDSNYTLSFDVASMVPDSLNISVNGENLASQQTTNQFIHMDIPVKLQAGDNTVAFNSTTVSDEILAVPIWMEYTRFTFKNVSVESQVI